MSVEDYLTGNKYKKILSEKKKREELERKKLNEVKLKKEKEELERKKLNEDKLREIEENLKTGFHSELDIINLISGGSEIYEELYPKIHKASGISTKTNTDQKYFIDYISQETGISKEVVLEDLKIGKDIIPELNETLKTTPIANVRKDLKRISETSQKLQLEGHITILKMKKDGIPIKNKEQINKKIIENRRTKKTNGLLKTKNIALTNKVRELEKVVELNNIKLEAWKHYPAWEEVVLRIAKKYGWSESKGFPKNTDLPNQYRKEWEETSVYVDLRGLRIKYVIAKYGKLVDEDTKKEIKNPHNAQLHHISTGTWHPKSTIMFEHVRILHKDNHIF